MNREPHQILNLRALGKLTAACVLGGMALAGCNPKALWDAPLTCRGMEESRTWVEGVTPARVVVKTNPLVVNFHMGNGLVTVKSTTAPLLPSSDGWVHFSSQAPTHWQAGQFQPTTGELSLVDGRRLVIDGQVQHITSTGRFSCSTI